MEMDYNLKPYRNNETEANSTLLSHTNPYISRLHRLRNRVIRTLISLAWGYVWLFLRALSRALNVIKY